MPYGLIDYDTLKNIARAIRYKANTNRDYRPRDMAQAINTIRSGGGFEEPTFYSLHQFYNNAYDNNIIQRGGLVKFEITNIDPSNLDGYRSFGNVNWPGMSPSEATFYSRAFADPVNQYGGLAYGLYMEGNYNTASLLSMDSLFYYAPIREAFCGRYTTSMIETYYSCYYLKTAVCGPNVQFLEQTYRGCSNLTEAVVGNNVISMYSAYSSCYNLINGISGPNVINMSYAYEGCSNLRSVDIGPKTKYINNVASYCYNLLSSTGGESVEIATNAFVGCPNLLTVEPMPNIVSGQNMFSGCQQLTQNSYNNFIFNARHLVNAMNMFKWCNNLNYAYISETANAIGYMYYGCDNLTTAEIDNNANPSSVFWTFAGCSNLTQIFGGASLTNIQTMFRECRNLSDVLNTPNVIDISGAYAYTNISEAFCGEYTTNMTEAYAGCNRLTQAVCGNNVITMSSAYQNCTNLTRAVCGNNVITMSSAYQNCTNLTGYAIGPKVNAIDSAFYNTKIFGDVEIPENVISLSQAFRFCDNVTNAVIKNATLTNYSWQVVNCFGRNNYTIRRNIVLLYLAAYNNFVQYNGAGNFYKTNETYDTPVEVNVNGISYNCVRCSYNTTYNCYIYCVE